MCLLCLYVFWSVPELREDVKKMASRHLFLSCLLLGTVSIVKFRDLSEGCTASSVAKVFSWCSLGIHKQQFKRMAYIGISHRGTLVGVHPTIPWKSCSKHKAPEKTAFWANTFWEEINLEPENGGLEDDLSFQSGDFYRCIWMFPKIGVLYPEIIHFSWVFQYKPSILGYPCIWKHPYVVQKNPMIDPTRCHGCHSSCQASLEL